MKIDGHLDDDYARSGADAEELKRVGYDGGFTAELAHDPFLALALAAEHAPGLELGTKIAVAFARSPMTLAYTAHDLNEMSGGRMRLGLGSQVKAHVTRRFSMEWSAPAARMREYVLALRAIWDSWRTGDRLAFEGEYYRHTLMTPTFSPKTTTAQPPKVWVAAVGPLMAEMAAEVSDGILLHPFWTPEYHDAVLSPAIERGLAKARRSRADIEISAGGFLVSGGTEEALAASRERVRASVAFYGSTPTYRGVLEAHGWGDLGDRLHELSVSRLPDKWERMTREIDDEVLRAFAVAVEPAGVARALADKNGRYADRIDLQKIDGVSTEDWTGIVSELRTAPAAALA
ncbi:TIGR03617 family F420-dependent LLM class oxidoreductase [Planctomonas sp. JC2975]|uniref:TIGR03617 family F420-dependent LLM class oxidoreductase n=1 Tax=Planctomonas sp. JC2975 TaxID=2729626 RepID=UPI001472BC45|nr:TIGR03617 family F420-dependent LLM class oxidoreductase [Planctomonas sp. JC2975]NNC13826.1 TIGR03617 family F420-dependent LLM class oxidoreductase [Planctomonas sp. JC2975]